MLGIFLGKLQKHARNDDTGTGEYLPQQFIATQMIVIVSKREFSLDWMIIKT